MKCLSRYTIVEFEYNHKLEAQQHENMMRQRGYIPTTTNATRLAKLQGRLLKAYKYKRTRGSFY